MHAEDLPKMVPSSAQSSYQPAESPVLQSGLDPPFLPPNMKLIVLISLLENAAR